LSTILRASALAELAAIKPATAGRVLEEMVGFAPNWVDRVVGIVSVRQKQNPKQAGF
jgi:hypothetical protein